MDQKKKKVLFHVVGCTLFIAQPVIFPIHPPGEKDFLLSSATHRDFLANTMMLLLFYANYYVFIPKFYFKKRYSVYVISLVTGLLWIVFLPSLITGRNMFQAPQPQFHLEGPPPMRQVSELKQSTAAAYLQAINHHIFLFIAVVSFSLLLRIRSRWFETEKARHEAEIANLISQINPHFLFNALNSIYTLTVKENATNSSEAMLKLSGMMRYVVTETVREFVPLEKEIAYINDYVELQKLRLDKSIQLRYSCQGVLLNKQLAPLLLIPFIENAFKYGVNPDKPSDIEIHLTVEESHLQLRVSNYKVISEGSMPGTGLGIKNTKNRLALLYSSKHTLDISETDSTYSVNLILFFK